MHEEGSWFVCGLGIEMEFGARWCGDSFFVGRIRTAGTHPTWRPLVACLRLET